MQAVIFGFALILCLGAGASSQMKCKDECTIVANKTVDSRGGEITVTEANSPLAGTRVVFPPDALSRAAEVSLGCSRKPVHVNSGKPSGLTLVLLVKDLKAFSQPVSIDIAYDAAKAKGPVVPYEIDEKGRLHVAQISRFDKQAHRLTFVTFTPGAFTWVYSD
jgi:hypothetical protein